MFGANILPPAYLHDAAKMLAHLKRLKAGVIVVMSDTSDATFAQRVKQACPETTVILRNFNVNDPRWHEFLSAAEVWDVHRRFPAELVIQVWNEPGWSPALIAKAAQVARFARQEGKRVALPTWAMGNPGELNVSGGGMDALLIELSADKRSEPNLLAVHEYGVDSTATEPYRVGRFRSMLERAVKIGTPIRSKQVAILEYGRDEHGDADKDGWKVKFHGDEQAYYNWLIPGVMLYREAGILGAAIFCYGSTWGSFDVQEALDLQKRMEAWNQMHANDTLPAGTSPVSRKVNNRYGVRLRALPGISAPSIRVLPAGEAVTLYQQPIEHVGDYDWGRIVTAKKENGWAALRINGVDSFVELNHGFTLKPPFKNSLITSRFNDPRDYSEIAPNKLQLHEGIDFVDDNALKVGSDPIIHAGAAGKVHLIGYDAKGYGNFVVIDFGGGYFGWYCHLAEVYIPPNATVAEGKILGLMGATGNATGPHCHFTLQLIGGGLPGYVVANVVNPELFLTP